MASGKLYTYPDNFRADKIRAVAKISGYNLTVSNTWNRKTAKRHLVTFMLSAIIPPITGGARNFRLTTLDFLTCQRNPGKSSYTV